MDIICYYLDQMTEPIETAELLAFTKTIEAKSLSRAAAELGTPRATIGRRLARLEERLGVRLLRRTTRALALTDAGEAFYRHAGIVLAAVDQAEESVRISDTTIRGALRVSVPPLAGLSFNGLVCDFARKYPEVSLQVSASSRYVDLHREGFDVALRASMLLEPGLVARTLAKVPVVAVASPEYLAEHGIPKVARDLRNHKCLLGFAGGALPQTHWPRAGGGKVHVEGAFVSDDIRLLAEAAMNGLGIALLPLILIGPFVDDGRLVRVLSDVVQAESRFSVVYPEKELLPPQVRAFVDAVIAWAPLALSPPRVGEACRETVDGRKATSKKGRTSAAR